MDLMGSNEEMLSNSPDLDFSDREKVIDLPDGWQKKVVRRMTGKTGESGRFFDVYLIPPTKGKRLRSSVELMKYILANPSVPIDGRCVNMERTFDVYSPKMTSGTVKLIQFIERVKAGEEVDINEFGGKPRSAKNNVDEDTGSMEASSSAAATPKSPPKRAPKRPPTKKKEHQPISPSLSSLDVQHLLHFQQQQLFQQRLQQQQQQLKQQQRQELLQQQRQQFVYQQQLIQKIQQQQQLLQQQQPYFRKQEFFQEVSKSLSPGRASQKKSMTPFLLDYLATTNDLLPDLTVSQAVELENLIDKSSKIPTPDQISEWASNFGVKYTDMQEWIGMKYFAKWVSLDNERGFDEMYVDDVDDDPLECDDTIIPASLCNVVMED